MLVCAHQQFLLHDHAIPSSNTLAALFRSQRTECSDARGTCNRALSRQSDQAPLQSCWIQGCRSNKSSKACVSTQCVLMRPGIGFQFAPAPSVGSKSSCACATAAAPVAVAIAHPAALPFCRIWVPYCAAHSTDATTFDASSTVGICSCVE